MTTWTQVQHFARQNYVLRRDEEDQLVIACSVAEVTDGSPVSDEVELVHAQIVTEFGEPWLLLRVAVCSEHLLDIPAALKRCARQVLGALVLADNLLALRHGVPLATLRQDDFERSVLFLARTAAYFRQRLHSPRTSLDEEPASLAPGARVGREVFLPWGD